MAVFHLDAPAVSKARPGGGKMRHRVARYLRNYFKYILLGFVVTSITALTYSYWLDVPRVDGFQEIIIQDKP